MLKYENRSLPPNFWNNNESRISCWLDTEPFNGKIYSYPLKYNEGTWVVKGVFCSLHCVKRYIIDNLFADPDTLTLFSFMCLKLYGKNHVKASPSFDQLNKFDISNGGLNIKEFRSCNSKKIVGESRNTNKKRKVSKKLHKYPAMGIKTIEEHLKPTEDHFPIQTIKYNYN